MTPLFLALALFQSSPLDASDAEVAAATVTDAAVSGSEGRPGAFEAFSSFMEGNVDGEFVACIPAQNADAHLIRATRRIRAALDLLDAERQSGRASPRVRAAYDLLADDSEMVMGRYMVQVLAERTCED